MHEDYTVCPICGDEDEPDPDCWKCNGAGVVEPDRVAQLEESARSLEQARCPKCKSFARRDRRGDLWCRKCDEGFLCRDVDAVINRTNALD